MTWIRRLSVVGVIAVLTAGVAFDRHRVGTEAGVAAELAALDARAAYLTGSLAALNREAPPRDLLDERVRASLGYRHAREVVLDDDR